MVGNIVRMEKKISLTTFIKESKDYRDLVRQNFVKPKFNAGPLIAVPQTINYGLVGTAFDYLLRFTIERKNKCETMPWIASRLKHLPLEGKINFDARTRLNLYLKTGKMTNALMESALSLATIDNVVRSGQGSDQIGIVNPLNLVDLSNLYELIDADKFKAKQTCYLNPTFGIGSELVNDADADLIIDNALIDIKTTKNPNFARPYFEQLIGYFLLHVIDCEHRNVPVYINKLGIYFSRHGCLFLMSVADLIDESKLSSIVSEFRDLLLISVPRKLSDEEKTKKAAILKIKAKAARKKSHELDKEKVAAFVELKPKWIEHLNNAKTSVKCTIEANPKIEIDSLIKIIDDKMNEFIVPDIIPIAWFWFWHKKTPSQIARAILAQYKKKHLA